MTETTETTDRTERTPRKLSKPAKIIGTGVLAAAAAFSSIGAENKNKTPDIKPQEATQDAITKQENNPDTILTPQETDIKIQEFIPKIDSLFAGVQVVRPNEFPDTKIIRTTDPRGLSDDKIPLQFQTSIDEEDYLTAKGVIKLAQNCNATDESIKVRDIEYTKNDTFFMRHVKLNCAGVAFGLKLVAEQTDNPQAKSALSQWRQIHIGILSAYQTVEPPTNLQSAIDYIDQQYYQSLQNQ